MLKFFDLFSQTPSLQVNGNSRLTTTFSAIIGLFAIMTIISGISIILYDFFSRFSYSINSYIDNSLEPNIDISKLKISFLITDLIGREFPDHERLFSIKAKHWEFYIPEIGKNISDSIKINEIQKINCNQYKNNNLMNEKFEMYSKLHNITCLDFENINKNLTGVHLNSER